MEQQIDARDQESQGSPWATARARLAAQSARTRTALRSATVGALVAMNAQALGDSGWQAGTRVVVGLSVVLTATASVALLAAAVALAQRARRRPADPPAE
jgi:cation transporter-like permease